MNIEYRMATEEDTAALVELHVAFRNSLQRSSPGPEVFEAAIRRLLADRSVLFGLALEKGRAVGYHALRRHHGSWSLRPDAVLEDLFVLEALRGKGVGRGLVGHALRLAKEAGCGAVSLDTNEANPASNKLYQKIGFTCERARWGGSRQIRYDMKLG